MGNLEHNIKEAFTANDANTKMANKDGMWNRLDNQMGRGKVVAAFWRVAAILLGFFFLTGAFAAFNYSTKQQNDFEEVELENSSFLATIDSLLSLPIATKTEIQVIEKVVYRNKPVAQQNSNSAKYWEERYNVLADSTELILANGKKQEQEIMQLNEELVIAKQKFEKLEQGSQTETNIEKSAPFELKSVRVEVGVSRAPAVKTPEMKMKVFQKNFIENRNNLNSTIFKK